MPAARGLFHKAAVLSGSCQDLAFWFDNIDLAAQATGGTADARALAAQMSGALVAFAKTGKPAHAGLADWPAYTAATRPTMVFENERASVKNDPDKDARALVAQADRRFDDAPMYDAPLKAQLAS